MQMVMRCPPSSTWRQRKSRGPPCRAMSAITPSAVLFVPSVGGTSHNPREFTRQEDIVNGANTLLHTLLGLMAEIE